jgi:hypothetical protein
MNNAGKVAFSGLFQSGSFGVTTDNDAGVWSEGLGALRLVAREGTQAPETTAGALFQSLDAPALNEFGQVAFYATLRTGAGGVTSANDTGIWGEDPLGNLRLIIREGDTIEVAPGNIQTVTALRFISRNANGGGHRSQFSDTGEVAFWANLSSGEAIFVSRKLVSSQIPGEYNNDGTVDAGDYVVWRKKNNGNIPLPNDNGLGSPIGEAHYELWRSHYGETAANAASATANIAVPEPGGLLLLLIGAMQFVWQHRKASATVRP